ncbi:hypothetical protein K466DRAFT_595196 [Polyporus arcularius HHB13444]|uniref:Uncharacterized protein n=1 Tax=Polyporus arcularius HHB13444 TaxID=1314778 RepID=A0A5C3PRN8_9APHY|nr:hypothetical protein K466DRAFT_595196 [Polyporus arcularius HHB13444]
MSNLNNEYPNAVLLTLDGNVNLTLDDHSVKRSTLGVRKAAETETSPVQVIITELLPETYGVVLRKSGPSRESLGSFVVNDNVKFGCQERSRIVDLAVHDEKIHALVTDYRLQFSNELDWLECVRLLEQAKSQSALRKRLLQENLKIAEAKDIVPEEFAEEYVQD